MRVFIAFPVTDEVKAEVARVQGKLKAVYPKGAVKWTNPEQIHVTVEFFGEISAPQVARAEQILEAAANGLKSLNLELGAAGAFPGAHNPKVLYIGLRHNDGDSVERWRINLHQNFTQAGFRPDGKSWQAHLTLGRVRERAQEKLTFSLPAVQPVRFEVRAVNLYQSELTPVGSRHAVLKSFFLQP